MNAIEFFEAIGVLKDVHWNSVAKGPKARITRRRGDVIVLQVSLPFCGTWIPHSDMSTADFLNSYKPVPSRRS
jgi:hypothetical protein